MVASGTSEVVENGKHVRQPFTENTLLNSSQSLRGSCFGAKRLTETNWKNCVSTGAGDHFESPQDAE